MALIALTIGVGMMWVGVTHRGYRVTMPNALPWALQGWMLAVFGLVLTLGALTQLLI